MLGMHIVVDLERLKMMKRMRPFQLYLEKARESHENPTEFAGTVETKVIIRTNALNLLSKKKTHPKRPVLLTPL